ncbi:hypothetical protein ACJMK2_013504 [Sinanodonta woodiana]|uniref:Gasdermin pore forming domain-containing protein n=1 Tax=Sinanodonta woodiana TaxID=1069815 RepID=A0ABD3UXR0_SINWO
MFSAACHQLVNSVGKDMLIPVPSLDEQNNVKPLQLVVMENKRTFFYLTKCSYHPTEFQLTDILEECSPISEEKTDRVLNLDYRNKINFSLKGKVGFDLFPDISVVGQNTSDPLTIEVKFGRVVKTEVDKKMLMEELKKRKLNLHHPFIEQVRKNKNKAIYLVTGVVHSTEEGRIEMFKNLDSKAGAFAKMPLMLSENAEANIEKIKVLGLESDTALAYSVHELDIRLKDGSVLLGMPLELDGRVYKRLIADKVSFFLLLAIYCHLHKTYRLNVFPGLRLNERFKVNLYQLVVMDKQDKCFINTEFQLTEILKDCDPISLKVKEKIRNITDSSMDIGKDDLGIWTAQVKISTVVKTKVDIKMLNEELMKRKLNLHHPFIEQVRKNNTVIYLVTEVFHSKEEGHVKIIRNLDSEETQHFTDINIPNIQVLPLESNTTLAVNIQELYVSFEDGSIKLEMPYWGHERLLISIHPNVGIHFHYTHHVFQAILDLPEKDRNKMTSVILNMMSVPRDIQIFIKLVEELASQEIQNIIVQDLEKLLLTQKESWLYLLELAGITVQASGELNVPREVTPLLKCFGVLFGALSELQEEKLDLIGKCAPQTVPALFVAFEAGLSNIKVTLNDVEKISKDDKAIELLKQLGYSVSEQEIIPPKNNLLTIDEVYVVMFALWGQKSK